MDEAHKKAHELMSNGRLVEADPWFLNALSRIPGNLSLIADIVEATEEGFAGQRPHEALQQREWLVRFLGERVTAVAAKDLPALLHMLNAQRSALQDADQAESVPDAADHIIEDVEAALNKLKARLPASSRDLQKALALVESVPADAFDPVLHARLQAAVTFERALPELERLLSVAERHDEPVEAAYLLTSAELMVRDLYQLLAQLDAKRSNKLATNRRKLEELSSQIRQKQAEQEASDHWPAWKRDNRGRLKRVKQWKAPKKLKADGACQSQLDALQNAVRELQEVMPLLGETEPGTEASDLMRSFGERMQEVSVEQHQRYNRWAMSAIERAFKQGVEQLGVVTDDKVALGQKILNNLGPIDQRMLTGEVQRCYSEVFEFLFKSLDAPAKGGGSFDEKGNKLYVLKRLANASKKTARDF